MNSAAERVLVIAEIGVNHNGSLEVAKKLVEQAANAGADYAKFQTFTARKVASADASVAEYQKVKFSGDKQIELLEKLELRHSEFRELADYCQVFGLGILTTAHDLQSAEFVLGLSSDFIKVPSGDVTNLPFLRLVGASGTPVLLSTGASQQAEVEQAILALDGAGLERANLTVMQCTTEYPAPSNEANLRAMVSMGERWGVNIGYSDHTQGYATTLAAVALGARVIEKHLTLDRNMDGPDHAASLEPQEFLQMVSAIREVESAFGSGRKIVSESEAPNREHIRKSIVAIAPIAAGELMTEENIGVMRPGDGVSPMLWDNVIGHAAPKSYSTHDMVELP